MSNEKSEKTIFEKIVDREIPATILYEDRDTLIFLDAFPFDKGHALVIPKKPYETVWDMPENEYLNLQKALYRYTLHVRSVMNKPVAIFQRNLAGAGQEVPHVHFHILPRTTPESKKPVFNFPKDGDPPVYDSEEEKQKYADMLRLRE